MISGYPQSRPLIHLSPPAPENTNRPIVTQERAPARDATHDSKNAQKPTWALRLSNVAIEPLAANRPPACSFHSTKDLNLSSKQGRHSPLTTFSSLLRDSPSDHHVRDSARFEAHSIDIQRIGTSSGLFPRLQIPLPPSSPSTAHLGHTPRKSPSRCPPSTGLVSARSNSPHPPLPAQHSIQHATGDECSRFLGLSQPSHPRTTHLVPTYVLLHAEEALGQNSSHAIVRLAYF